MIILAPISFSSSSLCALSTKLQWIHLSVPLFAHLNCHLQQFDQFDIYFCSVRGSAFRLLFFHSLLFYCYLNCLRYVPSCLFVSRCERVFAVLLTVRMQNGLNFRSIKHTGNKLLHDISFRLYGCRAYLSIVCGAISSSITLPLRMRSLIFISPIEWDYLCVCVCHL